MLKKRILPNEIDWSRWGEHYRWDHGRNQ